MKKVIATALLAFAMLTGTASFAQSAEGTLTTPDKTQQVIASIPSLQSIALEISQFEAKTAGRKENQENTTADLRALKMKYAAELKTQIVVNKDNKETHDILMEELKKTQEELSKLK